MPHALIVRLPSGTEYWYVEDVPAVGDTVSHYGRAYIVCAVEPSDDGRIVITLEQNETTADPVGERPRT